MFSFPNHSDTQSVKFGVSPSKFPFGKHFQVAYPDEFLHCFLSITPTQADQVWPNLSVPLHFLPEFKFQKSN